MIKRLLQLSDTIMPLLALLAYIPVIRKIRGEDKIIPLYLLITFFIFTTTMSQPTAMKLFLPKDADKPEDQNKAKESGVITILLGNNNNVFYYEGQLTPDASNFKSTTFKEIRTVLMDKKQRTPEKDLVVILKPSSECTYRNVIDILDEMSINVLKRYALVDISSVEEQLVKLSDKAGGPNGAQ